MHDAPQQGLVDGGDLVEGSIKDTQQPRDRPAWLVMIRPSQNHRAEHWCECERHHTGEHNGHRHGDGELAVKHTDRPRHERYRHKHCGHHQRDGDHRSSDLVQHMLRGLVRRERAAVHLCMHRLHHDNGIIHHDANGQHQGKERDQIDCHAKHLHQEEGPDE